MWVSGPALKNPLGYFDYQNCVIQSVHEGIPVEEGKNGATVNRLVIGQVPILSINIRPIQPYFKVSVFVMAVEPAQQPILWLRCSQPSWCDINDVRVVLKVFADAFNAQIALVSVNGGLVWFALLIVSLKKVATNIPINVMKRGIQIVCIFPLALSFFPSWKKELEGST